MLRIPLSVLLVLLLLCPFFFFFFLFVCGLCLFVFVLWFLSVMFVTLVRGGVRFPGEVDELLLPRLRRTVAL